MAVVLRRNLGTALTFDQLDDNFVDYTTFRDKFDQSEWTGSSDGYFLYFDNPTGKIKVKALDSDDLSAGFGANFTSALATKTTDNVSEGSANLYYTSARANADFDTRIATKSTTNLSEGSNKYYTDARVDARIGAINTDSLSEGSSNLYYTDSRADARISNATLQTLANVDTATASDDGKFLKYDHSSSRYVYGTGTVSSTDAITEGSSNLYFTNARADVRVNAVLPNTGSLTEGSNLYFTNARADARVNLQTGTNLDLSNKSTTNLSEGTNLYYTDARADARISNATLQTLSNVESPAGVGDNGKLLMYRNDGGSINRYELVQFSTTDQLPEGSSNLYYTNARADARIGAASINALSDVDTVTSAPSDGEALVWNASGGKWIPGSAGGSAGGDITAVNAGTGLTGGGVTGSVSFNVDVGTTANKIVQLDGSARLPAVDGSQLTNISYTPTFGQIKANMIDTGTGVTQIGTHQIPEVTNLYYTDARARAVSIENVVEDTTPQLGGNLDTNNKEIQSSSTLVLTSTDATNGGVGVKIGSDEMFSVGKINPLTFNSVNSIASFQGLASKANTNGTWVAGGFNFNDSGVTGSIEGSGVVSSSGDIALVGDIDFSSGVVSGEVIGNLYVDHPTNKSMVDGMMTATIDGVSLTLGITAVDAPMFIMANSGNSNATSVVIGHPNDNRIHILDAAGNTIYKLPATDGTAGQVLTTNGNGDLYWN